MISNKINADSISINLAQHDFKEGETKKQPANNVSRDAKDLAVTTTVQADARSINVGMQRI